ncbi:MAG: single-stranded-DNA-specific exonuclease [Candidatus Atribacteria bacterium]|jgi:single-stranded-DNA-specific exonuclease|uniref:Single-stranded-DNA-specific exonuclease RecJ n=1 Tax=Thermatribacter velox TaxID=3039681 RepID=A0ABZ2YDR6_9BACT|nr:single-stranded-DNA-specific exonuclease [Candidatus Atribacteria bacterium]MDI3530543.1 single-stranded-DNA-specific exonuclease [Candidatus Atribacteria bacterium]
MGDRKWQIRKINKNYLYSLAKSLSMPLPIARVLVNRGLFTVKQIQEFFEPSVSALDNLLEIPGLRKASVLLDQSLRRKERILVFGDYDADGVTGCAILTRFLRKFSDQVFPYLPNRFSEGYGLSENAIRSIIARGIKPNLVITVDCGIKDFHGVRRLKELGAKVVVTDHHVPEVGRVPEADVVVSTWDWESGDLLFPLSGAGIALALIRSYADLVNLEMDPLDDHVGLACIGTVGDVVPLLEENRVIVRYGLERINKEPCCGLQALLEVSGVLGRPIGSEEISFVIAPRINAAGRIEDPYLALSLFLSREYKDALKRANYLNSLNSKRQREEEKVIRAIFDNPENQERFEEEIVVLSGEGWNPGVLGIVASRVSEKLNKPVIVLSCNGEDAIGSGRSIAGFNLVDALSACSSLLVRFGGHEMAAGLRLPVQNIVRFRESLNDLFSGEVAKIRKNRGLIVDAIVNLRDVDVEMLQWLQKMRPFGEKNPNPLFASLNVSIVKSWVWGRSNRHLRLLVKQGREAQEAVVINGVENSSELASSILADFVFEVQKDNFGHYPYLKVHDWRIKK